MVLVLTQITAVSGCCIQDAHDVKLEDERDRLLTRRAITVQRIVRGYLAKKRYLKMKKSSVVIQKTWRGHQARQRYIRVCVESVLTG